MAIAVPSAVWPQTRSTKLPVTGCQVGFATNSVRYVTCLVSTSMRVSVGMPVLAGWDVNSRYLPSGDQTGYRFQKLPPTRASVVSWTSLPPPASQIHRCRVLGAPSVSRSNASFAPSGEKSGAEPLVTIFVVFFEVSTR